jgi:hypothetical protein
LTYSDKRNILKIKITENAFTPGGLGIGKHEEGKEEMKNMSARDSFASKELVEIAKLLESGGYNVHAIEAGTPQESVEEVGLFFTVKLSKYVNSGGSTQPVESGGQ